VKRIAAAIPPLDRRAMAAARERQNTLTKPPGSLGRLEELSIQLAGIRGDPRPQVLDKVVLTMAGDHGVAAEGVTLYPQEVTAQMVRNFLAGGAAVNVLCRQVGARVVVADLGVAADLGGLSATGAGSRFLVKKIRAGTSNMAAGAAMSEAEALGSLEAGAQIVEEELSRGMDVVGVGEMGIGNTTAAAAIAALITGEAVAEVTGRGTGLDDRSLARKVALIERVLAANRPDPRNPVGVLAAVGGFEIGGMAGAMLAAAARRVPVVLDGFISGAAALIACAIDPRLRDYLIASHQSVEIGHAHVLRYLGLKPVFNLDLRLGEGTGAALGISLVEAAARILREMATFAEAGVSGAEEK
jgi:nicotinate-nucleotide--dimethylbenzimidazole phosphoribosyltransferase